MTFSIVARSADGESWGVAVASKFLAVGSAVPAAVAGVGAIATQADANVAYKGQALAHLDDGATASVALQRLLEEDEGRDHRQVGIVDVDGGAATHTGHACLDWAGSVTGDGYAIQGNILAGEEVVEAMRGRLGGLRRRRPAGPPAARRARRRRRRRRRQARPPVGGAARGHGRRRVRRPRRHRGRPARRRPRRPGRRAGPAARPQRPLPDRLDRGGEGAGHRRAASRARGARDRRSGHRDFHAWVGTENYEMRVAPDGCLDRRADPRRSLRGAGRRAHERPRHRRRHHRRHRGRRRPHDGHDRGQGLPGVRPALPASRAGSSTRPRRSGRRRSRRPAPCSSRSTPSELQAVGITNQRETILLWDRETLGSPRRAIVWQDRRTADICTRLRDAGHEDRVTELTGLRLDPYFSGTKLMWLAENEPHTWALVESGRYAVGTVDSYLIARMTRGTWHVTDVSNACRTLLFDLADRRLVRRAVRAVRRTPRRAARAGPQLGRDRHHRPAVVPRARRCRSPGSPATSSRRCSARPASTRATPSAPTAPGRSSSPTPAPRSSAPTPGCSSTAAWRSPDGELTYALEGAIFVTGAAVQWLRDGLQIVGSAAETAAIAATVAGHRGRGVRAGADRARRPALGPARPRPDHRPHPRHHPRPHRPRDAGGDRVRGARRARDDARLARARPRLRVDGGAARQRPALPDPGRPGRRTRRAAEDRRDHRARRGVPRRPRHRRLVLHRRPARDLAAGPPLRARRPTGPPPTPPTPAGSRPSSRSKGWATS